MSQLEVAWLGRVDYAEAWDLQLRLSARLRADARPGVLLLLEHPHVFTMGRSADPANLLWDAEERRRRSVELVSSDRGGDVTYHGPGQLVGYPILDLHRLELDILGYLRILETSLIEFLARRGVQAAAGDREHIGVWVGNEKVAAIGIKVAQGLTSHGFALNLTTDLGYFEGVVPCGLAHLGVTSLERLGGAALTVEEAALAYAPELGRGLGCDVAWIQARELKERLKRSAATLEQVKSRNL